MSEAATAVPQKDHKTELCTDPTLLPIPTGGTATTVYISVTADGATLVPAFSLTPTGTAYKGGMCWQRDAEFGLFLNFQFLFSQLGTILGVDANPPVAGLWYSKAQLPPPVGGFNQQCCTQNVLGTYDFQVTIRDHTGKLHRVDPKIVVTPQTL
jgi:hypothetical protein